MQIEDARKSKPKDKKRRKRKLSEKGEALNQGPSSETTKEPKRKKRRKLIKQPDRLQTGEPEVDEEGEGSQPASGNKKESNRQRKRKKYLKLLAEKKAQTDVVSQQKSLNYLSQWKHNKEAWKFEKLRQVWLQQNLFSTASIPDKFWKTALEYFSGSKGQTRKTLIQEAMKIIETAEKEIEEKEKKNESNEDEDHNEEQENSEDEEKTTENEEDEIDEEINNKLNRAREILQYLQE